MQTNSTATRGGGELHPVVRADVGEGWILLAEGTPLQPGDGFLHPDYPDFWTDYECRPDIFRGGGSVGSRYRVPKRDYAHTWPWRRRVGSNDAGQRHSPRQETL